MLKQRIFTSICAIPIVVAAVWFDWPITWFPIFAAIVGILALIEFYRLTGVSKTIPMMILGLALTILIIIAPELHWNRGISLASLALIAAIALPMILMIILPRQEGLFRLWAWTLTGVLYIGWFISYLVMLRLTPDVSGYPDTGRNLVFIALLCTFGSDTLAYFVGKAIGTHKMAPSISPGKSWEGAVAGVVGGIVVSLLFAFDTPFKLPMNFGLVILLGALISVFGQIGDLAESMLKRGTGVKDSGNLMPGHGGMLDRLDSILFAGVTVYLFYMLTS
jgi:phosphatidate cytidylyltransferase